MATLAQLKAEHRQKMGDLPCWEPATLSPEVQTQAEELLARMDTDDLSAAWEHAELAAVEEWPCWGMTWEKWANEVTARPVPQMVGAGVMQRKLL